MDDTVFRLMAVLRLMDLAESCLPRFVETNTLDATEADQIRVHVQAIKKSAAQPSHTPEELEIIATKTAAVMALFDKRKEYLSAADLERYETRSAVIRARTSTAMQTALGQMK